MFATTIDSAPTITKRAHPKTIKEVRSFAGSLCGISSHMLPTPMVVPMIAVIMINIVVFIFYTTHKILSKDSNNDKFCQIKTYQSDCYSGQSGKLSFEVFCDMR